jgi:four helix bundle protein
MEVRKNELFDFEKLHVYQKSLDFVDRIYDLTGNFPQKEIYNITSRFKRAAYSISLNIGEGSAGSRKKFIRFLTIAKRSLRECVVCTISFRKKYIDEKSEINLRAQLTEISKMLSGLTNYLESDKAKNVLSEPLVEYNNFDSLNQTTTNNEQQISPFLLTDNGTFNSEPRTKEELLRGKVTPNSELRTTN